MNINEILNSNSNEIFNDINEAHHTNGNEYDRYWKNFTKQEAEKYNREHGTHIHGRWIYRHREVLGLDHNDKRIVHHKDHNKFNNDPKNLQIASRSEHCIIDPNALKHKDEKCSCKGCNEPYYAKKLCYHHYQKKYRDLRKKLKN